MISVYRESSVPPELILALEEAGFEEGIFWGWRNSKDWKGQRKFWIEGDDVEELREIIEVFGLPTMEGR